MAWTIYRSTDASAPVLTGQNQVMLNMLGTILTGPSGDGTGNAYGTTPCAGWTEEFIGADPMVRVYRPGPGAMARQYFRMYQPDATQYVYTYGYTSMSDVNTGSDPFPSAAPPSQTPGNYSLMIASATTNATARPWVIAADDRTFIILVKDGTVGNPAANGRWYCAYYGEFASYVANDLYQTCCVASTSDKGNGFSPFGCYTNGDGGGSTTGPFTPRFGIWVARNENAMPDAWPGNYAFHGGIQPFQGNQYGGQIAGIFPGLNPADGKYWYTHIPICHSRIDECVRGVLRGIWMPCTGLDVYADQDTFEVSTDDGLIQLEQFYTYGNTFENEGPGVTFHGNILIQTLGDVPST